jgi:hypothetical protein
MARSGIFSAPSRSVEKTLRSGGLFGIPAGHRTALGKYFYMTVLLKPFSLLITLWLASSPLMSQELIVVRPVDHGEALTNPGMGWNYAYFTDNQDANYSGTRPIDDLLDWFPGVTAISFRVGWARIEPEEGQFNWDYTDRIAQKWIEAGKQVAYCWLVFSTAGSESATPKWLKEAGAKGWTFRPDTPREQWIPNWDDPIFLEKLGNFLRAAGQRYDGKAWVQFIEPGSLGTWGEGHNWTGRDTPRAPQITLEAQKLHIDLWRQHFANTALLINDDYNQVHSGGVEYAAKLGYGLADWSIMVEDTKPYKSAHLASPIWPQRPIGLENEHYGPAFRRGNWHDGGNYLDAVERYHASFARIHWWPDEFLNGNGKDLPGNRELVDRINRRLGYRLQVVEASWPAQARARETVTLSLHWRNAGVAPCYNGGHPAISLVNAAGEIILTQVDSSFNVRTLPPGATVDLAPVTARTMTLQLPPALQPGEYNLLVSVGDAQGMPFYRLPVSEYNLGLRYRLGKIRVTP